MATLERAIAIAAEAHAGQADKGGQPYILHALRVMLRVQSLFERMAAVLHDVIEDTYVTFEMLREEGFPEEVIEALDVLTRRKGESRMDAARRARKNPIALAVKLADNAENLDLSRIPEPTPHDLKWNEGYKVVRAILLGEAD